MEQQIDTNKIRKLMKMANISERELAACIDMSRSSINSKLNNYQGCNFTQDELKKIANIFCVKEEYLKNNNIQSKGDSKNEEVKS
ncbi:MAG: helix-turn-helix transcriptional regulator [Bacillota bacterium]